MIQTIVFNHIEDGRFQAVFNKQPLAHCNVHEIDAAMQLVRLGDPMLQRLANWLMQRNEGQQVQVLWGTLLVLAGRVEWIDRSFSRWQEDDFSWSYLGRVAGERNYSLIQDRGKGWQCSCQSSWLPGLLHTIKGIPGKKECCRHEIAYWLTQEMAKRQAGQFLESHDGWSCFQADSQAIPLATTTTIKTVFESHPYQVIHVPGSKQTGREYTPSTYHLLRRQGIGLVIHTIQPGRQWRKGIQSLRNHADVLIQEGIV